MPTTSNRGYPYPATTNPATVPVDLEKALTPIDADVQELRDGLQAALGAADWAPAITALNAAAT